jgi:predicted acylesterase/phospholipase RssA
MNALPTRKCYTVAIEGGGSNGAWEAGCFLGMNNYLNKTLKYDAFSGISVGSIMSGSLAQYENLTEGIETTANLWLTIVGHQQVWNYWPLGIKAGLWHHGFVNNQAESLELKFNITEDMKYPVYFGSVNALNGTFVRF